MPQMVIGSGVASSWQPYTISGPYPIGVYVDVDTSHAHFPRTPIYVCSLSGNTTHWKTTGGNSIYSPTATGFRVYVRWQDGTELTPETATANGWQVNWIGQYFYLPFPEGPDPEL
jgi:hypothetical protein